MKKMIAVLISLLLSVGAIGCGGKTVTDTVTGQGFSKSWVASDDELKHDTGALAVDDGWGAFLADDLVRGALVRSPELDLKPTAYKMVARLCTDGYTAADRSVAGALRAVDSEGNVLGEEVIRVADFGASMAYKDFTLTFEVVKSGKVRLEVYWPGYSYLRCSELAVMSKTLSALPDFDAAPKKALGADVEETVEYDANALYYFDLYDYMNKVSTDEEAYDVANLVCTLQGIVNRDSQRLFVRFQAPNRFTNDTDNHWLSYLRVDGGMLAGKTLVTVKTPATLLKLFENQFAGFAVWDEQVLATVNAAATACGVENLLPLRYSEVKNSIYHYLTELYGEQKPVKYNLGKKFTGKGTIYELNQSSTGSRKNDVYLWAKAKFLDTKKTNSHLMAYHVDAMTPDFSYAKYADLQNMYLSNRDYYIAEKSFFFDLSVMSDEIPDDDPDQAGTEIPDEGTLDYQTLTKIMTEQNKYAASANAAKPIDIGGFTPWHLKYTRYTDPNASGEVTVEWATTRVLSAFNAYINADAPSFTAMANASIYRQFDLKEAYLQKGNRQNAETAKLPAANEQGANYILFYMGDYDASAWQNTAMTQFWNDSARGELPLCWPFSPGMADRSGHVIDMMYNTATQNDYFVAGDNGIGYLNPESFTGSIRNQIPGLNGDLASWTAANRVAYKYFDLDIQGFLITEKRDVDDILKSYASLVKGIATNQSTGKHMMDGAGIVRSLDATNVGDILSTSSKKQIGDQSSFTSYRFILRSPTDVKAIWNELRSSKYSEYNFKLVDPYTFYKLNNLQYGAVAA